MRLEDRVCSAWWAVEQGLCYGCMLTPLLSNITFAAVIKSVTYTRFKVDKDIDEKGVGGAKESNHRRASPGDVALGHALR